MIVNAYISVDSIIPGVLAGDDDEMPRVSHPGTVESVMKSDRETKAFEPDCSPQLLDIMALRALYQSN